MRRGYGKPKASPSSLGERIRSLRLNWGWNQGQLAEAINSNQKTVSTWERDLSIPSGAALGSLALLFGLSKTALLTGRGFTITETPKEVGPLLVAGAHAHALVHLPDQNKAGLLILDRRTGEVRQADRGNLARTLRKAEAEGRPVWVVIG